MRDSDGTDAHKPNKRAVQDALTQVAQELIPIAALAGRDAQDGPDQDATDVPPLEDNTGAPKDVDALLAAPTNKVPTADADTHNAGPTDAEPTAATHAPEANAATPAAIERIDADALIAALDAVAPVNAGDNADPGNQNTQVQPAAVTYAQVAAQDAIQADAGMPDAVDDPMPAEANAAGADDDDVHMQDGEEYPGQGEGMLDEEQVQVSRASRKPGNNP